MLNADLAYIPYRASENGYLSDGCTISPTNKYGGFNKPYLLKNDGNTVHLPDDFAEGIRFVDYYSDSLIIITLKGVDTSGKLKEWSRSYNGTVWSDWVTNIASNNLQSTKTFFGEVSAYPEYYTVYAHGVAVFNEASKTMDLHFSIIPTKVDGVSIPSSTYWKFLSKDKFLQLLGITGWSFTYHNTSVKPCIDTADITSYCGKTGLIISPDNMALARFYTGEGGKGDWSIDNPVYEKLSGKQINIDIHGATYS